MGDCNSSTHNELNKAGKHNELHAEKLAMSGNTQRHFTWATFSSFDRSIYSVFILFGIRLTMWLFSKKLKQYFTFLRFTPEHPVITAIIITYRISNFLTLLFFTTPNF